MDTKRTNPESPTPLTKALAVGVFVCACGGIVAQLAGVATPLAMGAMITAVILAGSAAVLEYRRAPHRAFSPRMRPPLEAAPDEPMPARPSEEGETWLGIDSAYATQMARGAWMAYLVPVVLIVLWAWMRHGLGSPSPPAGMPAIGLLLNIMMGGTVLICAIAAVLMQGATKRVLRSRIGADPTHLLYDPGTGKIERYEWSSVLTDKFHLLMGRRMLALLRPAGVRQVTVFPAEGLRALMLAHLPTTSFVGRGRLQWIALRRGNSSLWAMCAALIIMVVLHLLKEMHPEWFTAARKVLLEWLRAAS